MGRLSLPRDDATCSSVSGQLVLFGGAEGLGGRRVEGWRRTGAFEADVRTLTMAEVVTKGSASAALGGRFVVSGGVVDGGTSVTSAAWALEPSTGLTVALSPMAVARSHHALIVLPDGSLLAFGGAESPVAERYVP